LTKKCTLLIVLAFWIVGVVKNNYVFSQDLTGTAEEEPDQIREREPAIAPAPGDTNRTIYYIRKIDFDITGRTRPFALMDTIDLREGEKISGKTALETYIRRKTQLMRNERVLEEDKSRIDYEIREPGEDGLVPVDLMVYASDTWNIVALPYPEFDSNDGFSITLKARDYNFLGTMSPLRVDLGYVYDNNKDQSAASLGIDTDIPFKFLGLLWNFNFDNDFKYLQDDPFYYKNTTGLLLDLPWKKTTVTVGFDQSYILNEKNSDEEHEKTGVVYFDKTWYMSSELYAKWEIPLGITVGDFGELTYKPGLTETIKYRPGGNIGEYRKGPTTTFSHSFGFGQIDWIGNFRKGLDVSLSNSISYNNYNLVKGNETGWDDWSSNIGITAKGHLLPVSFFGVYGRLKFMWYINTETYSAGSELRGIPDKDLIAAKMLSLNLQFPLRILNFIPSTWFTSRLFKPIDLEIHFSPFIDLALLEGRDNDTKEKYTPGNLFSTAGFEIIAYSLSWRNLYLRGSIGWNLQEWRRQGELPHPEVFIGMEHYF
jgi:hypothetical protein